MICNLHKRRRKSFFSLETELFSDLKPFFILNLVFHVLIYFSLLNVSFSHLVYNFPIFHVCYTVKVTEMGWDWILNHRYPKRYSWIVTRVFIWRGGKNVLNVAIHGCWVTTFLNALKRCLGRPHQFFANWWYFYTMCFVFDQDEVNDACNPF